MVQFEGTAEKNTVNGQTHYIHLQHSFKMPPVQQIGEGSSMYHVTLWEAGEVGGWVGGVVGWRVISDE